MAELLTQQQRYTDEDIARGLTEVAAWAGNILAAAESLKEQGHPIPRTTLHDWVNRYHVDRYQAIRRDNMPKVHDAMATACEDRFLRQSHLEAKAEDQLEATIHELKPGELSGALRNITVSKKLNHDMATVGRGRPTVITEHRDPEQILKQLAQRFGGAIDSTATEIRDADVVSEAAAEQPTPLATSSDRDTQHAQ